MTQHSRTRRVLLTGMSGTGKSSVIGELRARGHAAIDMDEEGWSEFDELGNQLWNEARLQRALDEAGKAALFISGCAENQVAFYPQLTHIILLSAPREVIRERLRTRENNPYGKDPAQLAEVLGYIETLEPLLRRRATCEIVTTCPLPEVVGRVLESVFGPKGGGAEGHDRAETDATNDEEESP